MYLTGSLHDNYLKLGGFSLCLWHPQQVNKSAKLPALKLLSFKLTLNTNNNSLFLSEISKAQCWYVKDKVLGNLTKYLPYISITTSEKLGLSSEPHQPGALDKSLNLRGFRCSSVSKNICCLRYSLHKKCPLSMRLSASYLLSRSENTWHSASLTYH